MTKKDTQESPPETPLTIHQAMCAIISDIGPISKSKVNTEQNYKFRGIDAAMDALNPLMAKYGVFPLITNIETQLWEQISSKTGKVGYHGIKRYTFAFMAKDGTSVSTTTEGEAIDYGDKTVTKCQSVAYREALYKTFVAPFEASIVDPQGSVDIEDKNHDLYDETKDVTKTRQPTPRQTTPAQRATPPKAATPERLCGPYGIKKNQQVWEDYWIIKMGVRKHEKNPDGTPKNTMENMWSTFDDEIKLIFGKDKIEELTIKESMKLEDINRAKLADIIAEESRMRIEQEPGHTSGSTKVVHNRTTAGKTQ